MEHKGKNASISRSSASVVAPPVTKKHSARTIVTRLQRTKAAIRRFQEFKRNIVANPEKPGSLGRKPYFIYEKTKNCTPQGLYDPQFPSVSERLFIGLPPTKQPRVTRGTERTLETTSTSSMTSFVSRMSRFSIHGRGSIAPSLMSFGLVSFTDMSLKSVVLESDEEEEVHLHSTDRAPSMFRLREDPPPRIKEVKTAFTVTLTESATDFWLEIPSTAYPVESEEGVAVLERNAEYERVKSGSKTISHTAMQTNRMFKKHQQLHVPRNQRMNSSAYVTLWDIYDILEEQKKKLSSIFGVEGMVDHKVETPIEEESYSEEFEFQGHIFGTNLMKTLMVMERLVVREEFSKKQLLFQGLLLEDPLSLDVNFQYTLSHLWTFACQKTKMRKVTSICGNPANQNVLAVGYGKFQYTDKCSGLVCIWNVKNPKSPERVFEFPDPVTYVVFSYFRPQILAVSFYSGLILLVDIISRSLRIKASNSHYPLFHPVWQTLWFKQGDESQPLLLSCDKHGRVFRYKKTKFFLSKKIMSMGRPHGTIQGVYQPKKCYARKTLLNRNPSAEVMVAHPTDPLIYLVGTAEGFVYICSVNHRHDHIDVFVAHDGPIYNIQFNPFCDKIFLTCGADFTIRIWAEGIFDPLVTLESGMSAIQCALWDPLHSTIIVSITGIFVEVWDIRRRISVPKSSTKSPSKSFNTLLHFTQNKYNLCLGDDAGNVHVMALTQMPFSPAFQDVVLAQSLQNVLVTRPDLLARLERLGPPFSSEEKSYMTKMYRRLDNLHRHMT